MYVMYRSCPRFQHPQILHEVLKVPTKRSKIIINILVGVDKVLDDTYKGEDENAEKQYVVCDFLYLKPISSLNWGQKSWFGPMGPKKK
jgi:hypothetical protein